MNVKGPFPFHEELVKTETHCVSEEPLYLEILEGKSGQDPALAFQAEPRCFLGHTLSNPSEIPGIYAARGMAAAMIKTMMAIATEFFSYYCTHASEYL